MTTNNRNFVPVQGIGRLGRRPMDGLIPLVGERQDKANKPQAMCVNDRQF
jgi:hypothetical protein